MTTIVIVLTLSVDFTITSWFIVWTYISIWYTFTQIAFMTALFISGNLEKRSCLFKELINSSLIKGESWPWTIVTCMSQKSRSNRWYCWPLHLEIVLCKLMLGEGFLFLILFNSMQYIASRYCFYGILRCYLFNCFFYIVYNTIIITNFIVTDISKHFLWFQINFYNIEMVCFDLPFCIIRPLFRK